MDINAFPGLKYNRIYYAAAVCYRLQNEQPQYLIIRTHSQEHYTFPKGLVEYGESLWAAAERETYEEAGVKGNIQREPLGVFRYQKNDTELKIAAFLLEVTSQVHPGEPQRDPVWCEASLAKVLLAQNRPRQYALELVQMLEQAERCILEKGKPHEPV